MKYIIWGTGSYCCEKIDYIEDSDIVAFVERKSAVFRGRQTILPSEIGKYEYDYIVVMSVHYQEIISEMVEMGIDYKKIIPGINFRPYLSSELDLITSRSKVVVTQDGGLEYILRDYPPIEIKGKESWEQIRKLICCEENAGLIRGLHVNPVGKKYGSDRGGSILRYYLDGFLDRNRQAIYGRVLEIGDRNYTERYGTNVEESYVLHFDNHEQKNKFDFWGDLRNGEGIQENFYDCIIFTQVLNFIENIKNTPDILIKALKPGGKILVSVSGISVVGRFEMDRYGQYWNFTDKSVRNMFTKSNTKCEIWTKGNCKAACAFLQGMGSNELTEEELQDTDEDFQVVIFAVVTRIK